MTTMPDEKMNRLVNTWMQAYKLSLPKFQQKVNRLRELLTWDKPRKDNAVEHTAKIEALERLIDLDS